MLPDNPLSIVNVVMWIVLGAAQVATWLRKPGDDASKAIGEITSRVGILEERMRHVPSADELAQLGGTLTAVEGQLRAVAERLGRIETYLMSRNER